MKDLVLAIKDALQNGQNDIPADNISIVPDLAYIPSSSRTPAIGIKDGLVSRERLTSMMEENTMTVLIAIWVQILEPPAASVIGDGEEKGVLELVSTVRGVLDDNFLGFQEVYSAYCIAERASEMMGTSSTTLQRKVIEFKYIKESEG